jgi:drug/metabolite transporter (DMT)-like permease
MPSHIVAVWTIMTIVTASAAILTRYCGIPATSIGFWRVFGAACILAPWWVMAARRFRPSPVLSPGAALAGVFLGLHFATWAWALLHGTLANAALFIAMQPAITPIIGRWLAGDRLSGLEYAGTALACIGMAWIVGGQVLFTPDQIASSAVAFFSMICCTIYIVLGRRFRSREHVILFSVPVYLSAAAVQAILAILISGGIYLGKAPSHLLATAAIILVPTVGGHTLAMYLLRHVKAQAIALSIPLQFILIAIAGILLFDEWPTRWFYPGAALVTAGVSLAIAASGRNPVPGARL